MNEMIERVARAHYTRLIEWAAEHVAGAPFKTWDELPQEQREGQLASCRAAIEAMREPTEAMVTAAENADDPGSSIYCDPFVACAHDEAWRLMIDVILAEGERTP